MRNWNSLSASTQHRYERAGVGRGQYESGASLKAARGHAQTPERPSQAERNPEKFERYTSIRAEVRQLKREMYGDRPRFKDRVPKGSYAHLVKVRDILQAKLDFNGSWDEFWDAFPEYDRDDFPDVDKYH